MVNVCSLLLLQGACVLQRLRICANQLAGYSAGFFCIPVALRSVHCLLNGSRELVNIWLRNSDLRLYVIILLLLTKFRLPLTSF